METSNKLGMGGTVATILVFGSLWGTLECVLGGMSLPGGWDSFPMGALLGGFFGLGLMALTRRVYGVAWMQLSMGVVAGFLRFWAPIGTCVVCSALAIVAESLVFEIIFNRPIFTLSGARARNMGARTLISLGIISAYAIYVIGYLFTQTFTPIVAEPHAFVLSDLTAALPLIFGRGFFAAVFGAISLPLAVLYGHSILEPSTFKQGTYYMTCVGLTIVCWVVVIARFYL
jgi:hypothetical protein